MLPSILFLLGIVYYFFFYYRTKDFLNPIGLLLIIWCTTASISSLFLLPLQQKWNSEMIFVVISSSFAVFLAGYITIPKLKKKLTISNLSITKAFLILTRIVFFISLICVFIEWRYNNYQLSGFEMLISNTGSDAKSSIDAISGIHYGSILMPYCGIFAFFEYKYTKSNKIFPIFILFFSLVFYSFLFYVSRGSILTIILGIIYIQNKKKPLSLRKLIIYILLAVILFIVIALLRLSEESLVFNSLDNNTILNKYISSLYVYIGYNFENLYKLIKSNNSLTYFHYSLKFLWDLFGFRESLNIILYDTLFFNARTYLYPFYHDLGLLGTLLYPFIISLSLSLIYKKSYSNKTYILLLAVLQGAIINVFFGNYFFGETVLIWPYIITIFVIKSLRYNIK